MTVEDTPEYYWDTGYDGITGFSSCLKNRVSETSTPQGGQSPREGLEHLLNLKDNLNN